MERSSKKQQILQDLKKFVLSKAPSLYFVDEEDRVENLLKTYLHLSTQAKLFI